MDKAQYKMVPVEPTRSMLLAGYRQELKSAERAEMYRAMLAAAPQPPSSSGEREAALLRLMPEVLASLRADGMNVSLVADLERAIAAPTPGIDAAGQKPVACRILHRTMDGGWSHGGRDWCDGEPTAELIKHVNESAGNWRIELAYAAPPAAQPSADDKNFPFYELRFIMRVLDNAGSAPKEDWQTAYGMARDIFVRWSKDRPAAPPSAEWLAEAESLVDAYAKEFAQGGATYARDLRRADLLAHLRTKPSTEQWCDTMDRPKSKCGCPDCGPSLIDLGPGLRNTPGKP